MKFAVPAIVLGTFLGIVSCQMAVAQTRPFIEIRGIYGGVPDELLDRGSLAEYGVNAVGGVPGGDGIGIQETVREGRE